MAVATPATPRAGMRLTARGGLFLAVTATLTFAGAAGENEHLMLLACVLAGVLGATGILTAYGARRLEVARTLPAAVHAHETFEFKVSVRNGNRLTPAFALEVDERIQVGGRPGAAPRGPVKIALAAPGETASGEATATAVRRGRARFAPAAITTAFPPGLVSCRVEVPAPAEVVIYPRQGVLERRMLDLQLSQVERPELFPTARSSGNDDFSGLREYRPGDNPRRIQWKLLARCPDKLFVREYEDARARDAVILLDTLVASPRDARLSSRLERAISFAIALTDALIASNYGVRFLAFAPELIDIDVTAGRGALEELRHALAVLEPERERGLPELVAAAAAAGALRDEVVFVLGLVDLPLPPGLPPGRTVVIEAEEMRELMYYVA